MSGKAGVHADGLRPGLVRAQFILTPGKWHFDNAGRENFRRIFFFSRKGDFFYIFFLFLLWYFLRIYAHFFGGNADFYGRNTRFFGRNQRKFADVALSLELTADGGVAFLNPRRRKHPVGIKQFLRE